MGYSTALDEKVKLDAGDCKTLAAIIDCEGHIGLCREQLTCCYQARIKVTMVNEHFIKYINTLYPGLLSPYGSNGRTVYRWQLSGRRCKSFLEQVLPFLVIKSEQATLCLEHLRLQEEWKHKRAYPIPVRMKMKAIYQEIKNLNHS